MAHVVFVLIGLLWGASFILMKRAAVSFGPIGIGAWRVIGGAAVLGMVWWSLGSGWPFRRRHLGGMVLLVGVGYIYPFTIQPYLISRHGSGFIGMMVSFVPLLTVLASIPMLGVYPTRRQLLGVLGGLAFMGLLFADGLGRHVPPLDLALAAGVPLAYGVSNTYIKRRFSDVPPLAISCVAMGSAGLVLLGPGLLLPGEGVRVNEGLGMAVACLAVLGVLGTGLATYGFYRLIQRHGLLFAGMVTYLIPLGAVVLGWLDRERVTGLQAAALAGVLAMVLVVQYRGAAGAGDPGGKFGKAG